MAPRPYSERAALPNDDSATTVPAQIIAESPSPPTLTPASTPSPTPQEVVTSEIIDTVELQDDTKPEDDQANSPCYPTPEDIMPYDHSLPDFIRQITNQPNLANLQSLSLRVISTLISLHRMAMYLPNLRELDLEGSVLNSLRDIGCSLKHLQILKVGRCQLESLDGTFGLSSLRELYAQKNYINDVSPCSNLPHIRHIDVSGNRIRNISYAGFLSVCSKLKSIVFTGNPATEVSDYRKHVRKILPQLESLDGVPFLNEDNAEAKELELIENYCAEGSDSSSAEVPDFLSVSPSDSMNNLFESEEDSFLLEKRNKHARNVANQDQFEVYEVEEVVTDLATQHDLQEDLKNITLQKNKVKRGLLEQAKILENRNTNIKQKCASIQKLDKDMENRSKKSNLVLNANFTDELFSLPEIVSDSTKSPVLQRGSMTLPSSSGLTTKMRIPPSKDNEGESSSDKREQNKVNRPSTAIESSHSSDLLTDDIRLGAIKKRPSTALPKEIAADDDDDVNASKGGVSKLTSGLPVCGNLTAALRNRKKVHNAWEEKDPFIIQSLECVIASIEEGPGNDFESQLNGSGDNIDSDQAIENEEDLIGDELLASSQKWREAFRRYRSNNRAKWEEEDKIDYSSYLGESPDIKAVNSENEMSNDTEE